jgi:hypothetical protein
MNRVLAPISLSIWEEPGLLVKGHDHPPMVMMGHNRPEYEAWIERASLHPGQALLTYDLQSRKGFPATGEQDRRFGREERAHPHPARR